MRHLTLAVLPICLLAGCGSREPEPAPTAPGAARPAFFRDITSDSGVSFVHAQSDNGQVLYLPETLGPGTASIDYDGDGRPDLFFVQGSGPTNRRDVATVPRAALYRNAGPGARFDEVAAASGTDLACWGQGCLAFDGDNDGYQDLIVTGYHEPVRLLVNNGDGTFRPAAHSAGLPAGDRWWTFATAIDLERDGLLDLYVGSYVKFGKADWVENPPMIEFSGMKLPQTMAPSPYLGDANAFLSNRGNGCWEDHTEALGVADAHGRGMAALAADHDLDGWTDLFVANDVSPCALFRNSSGKLRETAGPAFVGESRGSMGVALGDVDRNGLMDIAVTHWVGDLPALYQCQRATPGKLAYKDAAVQIGLGTLPRDRVGWAVGLFDFDHDSRDDLLIINGHTSYVDQKGKLVAQDAVLFRGAASGAFEFVLPPRDGPQPLNTARVGRSAAFTDLDGDGGIDVAVGVNNGPAEIWQSVGSPGKWIGAQLVGTASSRDAVGARLKLTAGTLTRHAQVTSGESFFATNDPRRMFGLGATAGPCAIQVHWPSGRAEKFEGLAGGRYHRLVESAGTGL